MNIYITQATKVDWNEIIFLLRCFKIIDVINAKEIDNTKIIISVCSDSFFLKPKNFEIRILNKDKLFFDEQTKKLNSELKKLKLIFYFQNNELIVNKLYPLQSTNKFHLFPKSFINEYYGKKTQHIWRIDMSNINSQEKVSLTNVWAIQVDEKIKSIMQKIEPHLSYIESEYIRHFKHLNNVKTQQDYDNLMYKMSDEQRLKLSLSLFAFFHISFIRGEVIAIKNNLHSKVLNIKELDSYLYFFSNYFKLILNEEEKLIINKCYKRLKKTKGSLEYSSVFPYTRNSNSIKIPYMEGAMNIQSKIGENYFTPFTDNPLAFGYDNTTNSFIFVQLAKWNYIYYVFSLNDEKNFISNFEEKIIKNKVITKILFHHIQDKSKNKYIYSINKEEAYNYLRSIKDSNVA